jgi:hypothetical protein
MHNRLTRRFTAVLVLAGAVAAAPAFADTVLFSNLGPGSSYDPIFGYSVGPVTPSRSWVEAESFTPSMDLRFADAQLPMSALTPGIFTNVYLESDNSGTPGSILDTLLPQSPITTASTGSIVSFDCASCPMLSAGTTYWIVAGLGNGNSTWFGNNTGDTGGFGRFEFAAFGSLDGPWVPNSPAQGAFTTPALQVDGSALTPTPEPGSLPALGTLIAGLASAIHLRRTRAALP